MHWLWLMCKTLFQLEHLILFIHNILLIDSQYIHVNYLCLCFMKIHGWDERGRWAVCA